jgi:ribose transport system substrate-binding protein
MKKFKFISLMVVLSMVLMLFVGCASDKAEVEKNDTNEANVTKESDNSSSETSKEELDIIYVCPATSSQYWGQYIKVGVENACKDIEEKYGVKVNLEIEGPTTEAETDAAINTLEASVSKKPDGIVLGQLNPDAVEPLITQAHEKGIFVNLVSIGAPNPPEEYGSLYYCDQPQQGETAANAFYEMLKDNNLPLDGVVGVHMSVVVPVLEEKIQKFVDTLQGLAPDLTILETQYNENDINKAITNVENQLATYGEDELVGFFSGNNVTGAGLATAVAESGRQDKLVTITVDSDEEAIGGLKSGSIDGIIVQTPYEQAYRATMGIAKYIIDGEEDENDVNIPADLVTQENMNTDEMKALLDPTILAK